MGAKNFASPIYFLNCAYFVIHNLFRNKIPNLINVQKKIQV